MSYFSMQGCTSWARPYAQHHGGFVHSFCSTGDDEILNSTGQSPWKAAILGGGGKSSRPPALEALETFLDGLCIICQHLHSSGGYPYHLKDLGSYSHLREIWPTLFLPCTYENVFSSAYVLVGCHQASRSQDFTMERWLEFICFNVPIFTYVETWCWRG